MGSRLAAALILVASGVAGAQPNAPNAPNDRLRKEAGDLVKKAIAKSQAGDHEDAIELYRQAYILIPTPILLSNIASEYQSENKPVEALKYFCDYLKADPTGTNVTYATAQAKTLQIQLGRQVDDSDVCKPPEPPRPAEPAKPEPTVTATQTMIVEKPRQPGRPFEYLGLGIGGAGLVTFGVGIYYGLQAKSISDDISSHPMNVPWRNDIAAYEQEGQDDQTKQIMFMTAGGILAAGGAVLYWVGHSRNAAEHVSLRPVATPRSIGIAGSF